MALVDARRMIGFTNESVHRSFLALLAGLAFAACGGKTSGVDLSGSSGSSGSSGGSWGASSGSSGSSSGIASSSGTGSSSGISGSSSGGGGSSSSGGACVYVDPSAYDQSCKQDSDCVGITPGEVCDSNCECGGAAINVDGEARYEQAISSVPPGLGCGCPASLVTCTAGACCAGGPFDPPACNLAVDAGSDAGLCVNVDLSTYDTSCTKDSDCFQITAGELCAPPCLCGGAAINVSGEPRYNAAIAPLLNTLGGCDCPVAFPVTCFQNTCQVCSPSGVPCADGG
jgi:hypothetical protein